YPIYLIIYRIKDGYFEIWTGVIEQTTTNHQDQPNCQGLTNTNHIGRIDEPKAIGVHSKEFEEKRGDRDNSNIVVFDRGKAAEA
ncbi:18696_t:CDS:2, partial [Gigaspora rosea]